jgi:hypothetical protein
MLGVGANVSTATTPYKLVGGTWDTGTSVSGTARLNYNGYLYATRFYGNYVPEGTSRVAGTFYSGTTNPISTTRSNYDGNLHAHAFFDENNYDISNLELLFDGTSSTSTYYSGAGSYLVIFDTSSSGTRTSATLEVSRNSAGGAYTNTTYTVYGGFWLSISALSGSVGWDGLNLRGSTATGSPTSFYGSGTGSPITDARWRISVGTPSLMVFKIKGGQ